MTSNTSPREVLDVRPGVRDDIADLKTVRALPTAFVDQVDPFLFLNHHGPQVYARKNRGLPFGPHPHRGFETLTFILAGDLMHKDSAGHQSVINAGGVQWMTAGRGLIHSEISSPQFLENGGPLEILQLWINLPAKLKMTPPKYIGLQSSQIPKFLVANGAAEVALVSGHLEGQKGPVHPLIDVTAMTVNFASDCDWSLDIPVDHHVFFYVVHGTVVVNGSEASHFHLVRFHNKGTRLDIHSLGEAVVLICHAKPLNEPVVSHGPFVMNSKEEIQQAIRDYQNGLFGPDDE